MAAPEGLVGGRRASEITGRHRNTIQAAARAGEIPGAKQIGKRGDWCYTEAGLREWIGLKAEEPVAC